MGRRAYPMFPAAPVTTTVLFSKGDVERMRGELR